MARIQLAAIAVALLIGELVQSSTIGRYSIPPFLDDRSGFAPGHSLPWENPNSRAGTREDVNYRLPNNTSPSHYDVTLTTNVHSGNLDFTGIVVITIRVDLEDTKSIVVHALQLENFVATLEDTSTSTNVKLNPAYEEARQFLTLTPEDASELIQGRIYKLTIAYSGKLRTDNGGFYRSTYTNAEGQIVNLATTQFESTDARHAFPSYDEPAKRAKFTITINHDPSYTAISNMPVNEALTVSGKTVFQETPSMPTYLVAFIVSDFEYASGNLNGLPQRVFSRPGTDNDREFALLSGMQAMARLSEYFYVPYSLPKLDQVAVPDFAAGAMENWGLATYREEYMLANSKSTSNSFTNILNIICHEDTHMWFGDLVTPKWWSYLWLKESFATIYSYKGCEKVYPDWGLMQLFSVSECQGALTYDGYPNPRPMTHYVQTPREISSVYDVVSYSKGGCVLHMWENALTEEVFRAGLQKYLLVNAYGAAEEDDLFTAIAGAAKDLGYQLSDEIALMLKTWTNQGGIPLLTVERNYDDGSFTITQKSFKNDPSLSDEKLWYVPINYVSGDNPDFRDTTAQAYLKKEVSLKIDAKLKSNDDWLILNKQSTGYYRVQYDERNWDLISNGLLQNPFKIHAQNRASLLNDAYRLSASTYLKHSILLKLMTYLSAEDQYAPWSTANSILNTFDRFLNGDEEYGVFKEYVADLVENIYLRLGVHDNYGEQHFTKGVRNIAITLACLAGIDSCLTETNNKLNDLVNDGVEIEPNLESVIFCNGLKKTNDDVFDFVYNLLMTTDIQAKKRSLISSLGCAKDVNHINKFIVTSISDDDGNTLRPQERITVLRSAYTRGEEGLLASIEFLQENYEVYANLSASFSGVNPLENDIMGMSGYVTNKNQEEKLLALVEEVKSHPSISDGLESYVKNSIQTNFAWLEKNRDPIITWISNYKSGAGSIFASLVPAVMAACYAVVRLL